MYKKFTEEDTVDTVYEKFIKKLIEGRQHDIDTRTTRYGIYKDGLLTCIKVL